ncbi:DUF6600 domain-containing protein [Phycisphaerales bacterium AB-hyl4]|uniref:DUF6600 domain-containing protein n=1 Tax=Natronomicrosphaera hydrolytica TaxID=3242702 RepID=A0ABV4U6E8_9BACT
MLRHALKWTSGRLLRLVNEATRPALAVTLPAAMVAGLAMATPALADEGDGEFAMHARVSYDAGGTVIRGEEDDDWAFAPVNTLVLPGDRLWADDGSTSELEFPRGTFVRMADGSQMEVRDIGATMALRGEVGSFYVHRLSRSTGDVVFETPAGVVEIVRGTALRIDIEDDGSVTLSVNDGHAIMRAEQGGPQVVTAGQRVWVDPGLMPSAAVRFDSSDADSFDRWHAQRVDVLTTGIARTPLPDNLHINEDTLGVNDLGNYGEWVYIDNAPYWRPTVVTHYVPYRYGQWTHVPRTGQVWIGKYPFSHVTTHYGTWRYTATYGWVWSYHGQWSPAWATAIRYNDHYIWTPIDRHHRPVIVSSSASFTVGGVRFSLGASTYAPVTRIYTGPVYVRPLPVTVVRHIHQHHHHVHVWHLGPRHRHIVRVPYARTVNIHVHQHNHRHRWVRGPQSIQRGDHRVAARSRAMVLDQRIRSRQVRSAPSRHDRGVVQWSDRRGQDNVRSLADRDRAERGRVRRSVNLSQQEPDYERNMRRQRAQRSGDETPRSGWRTGDETRRAAGVDRDGRSRAERAERDGDRRGGPGMTSPRRGGDERVRSGDTDRFERRGIVRPSRDREADRSTDDRRTITRFGDRRGDRSDRRDAQQREARTAEQRVRERQLQRVQPGEPRSGESATAEQRVRERQLQRMQPSAPRTEERATRPRTTDRLQQREQPTAEQRVRERQLQRMQPNAPRAEDRPTRPRASDRIQRRQQQPTAEQRVRERQLERMQRSRGTFQASPDTRPSRPSVQQRPDRDRSRERADSPRRSNQEAGNRPQRGSRSGSADDGDSSPPAQRDRSQRGERRGR